MEREGLFRDGRYRAADSSVSRRTVKKRTSRPGKRTVGGVRRTGMAEFLPMTVRSRRSGGLALLLAAMVVAACGSSAPTSPPSPSTAPPATAAPSSPPGPTPTSQPAPSASPAAVTCDETTGVDPSPASDDNDPNAALYAKIEAQVSALRGITATTPVARGVFDIPGLCAYLRNSLREENPPEFVAATERLYRELLLLPAGTTLEKLYLDLLTSQVAGLYDDKTKHMYVVTKSGTIGPLEQITYAHEYTHALQDQAFGLRSVVGEDRDQGDRSLARTTLIEGDATLVMSLWAQQELTAAQLAEVTSTLDPAGTAALEAAPTILRESLLFPYTSGLTVALGGFQSGGGFAGVDALFANPPDSTEQVLHPEKFAAREAPVRVTIPKDLAARLGTGWKVPIQDTLGEFQLEVLLREGGASGTKAAAAGWGGDRVALVEGPDGAVGVVLDTVWDTAEDADAYAAALESLVAALKASGRSAALLVPERGRVVLVSGSSDDVLGRLANVLGLAE